MVCCFAEPKVYFAVFVGYGEKGGGIQCCKVYLQRGLPSPPSVGDECTSGVKSFQKMTTRMLSKMDLHFYLKTFLSPSLYLLAGEASVSLTWREGYDIKRHRFILVFYGRIEGKIYRYTDIKRGFRFLGG